MAPAPRSAPDIRRIEVTAEEARQHTTLLDDYRRLKALSAADPSAVISRSDASSIFISAS